MAGAHMSSRAVGAHGGHQSFLPSEAPSSAVTLGAVPNHVGTVLLASCQRALVGARAHGGARDRKAEVSHQRTGPVGAPPALGSTIPPRPRATTARPSTP